MEDIDSQMGGSPRNISFGGIAKHFLRIPSRILTRFDRVWLSAHVSASNNDAHNDTDASMGPRSLMQHRMREGFTPLPGPWGFLTSGYFIGLFFMVSPT